MLGVIRNYPGLRLLAGVAMLGASVGFGAGSSYAQQLVAHSDHQQADALPGSATKHAESMAAVRPSAPPTTDVKPVRRTTSKGPYYVDFRARTAATYGHAFIWYGKTREKQVEIAGLAPAGATLPSFLGHIIFV